ncbi:hypothetical protein GMORB2_7824 [Geosmithia morbida]|uniref:Rhodopsin domain-containing protein n=1 Tax=Geosmithia morbida TaxID=1094350 RepID=A0A9P4YV19_9HYPO|nr:uncharacterized protein GMORB2_7824 [Geosmithia morbida]KAF4122231.1 hypothetical protein GMORB2_7824 [Geosmithia morbida]
MAWVFNTPEGTPTDGPTLTGAGLAMTSLAIGTIFVRLYVRLLIVKATGWETRWGLGLDSLDDFPPENMYNFGLLQYIGAPFYVLGIWCFKLSLLLSYLRFMPKGVYRISCIVLCVLVMAAHIAFMCIFIFGCIPVISWKSFVSPYSVWTIAMQWDSTVTGKCVDLVTFYLTFSSLTIVMDVMVLLFPFPVLIKSRIQTRKKVVLLGLFALGIFVTVIQSIRIQTIKNLKNPLDSAPSIIWSLVENDIGIIICNIPTMSPLIKYFSEKTRSGTGSKSRQTGSEYVMKSWRSGKGGMQPLGSGVDPESEPSGSGVTIPQHRGDQSSHVDASKDDGGSGEYILESSGIIKTTDVVVTSRRAAWNGDRESISDSGHTTPGNTETSGLRKTDAQSW